MGSARDYVILEGDEIDWERSDDIRVFLSADGGYFLIRVLIGCRIKMVGEYTGRPLRAHKYDVVSARPKSRAFFVGRLMDDYRAASRSLRARGF